MRYPQLIHSHHHLHHRSRHSPTPASVTGQAILMIALAAVFTFALDTVLWSCAHGTYIDSPVPDSIRDGPDGHPVIEPNYGK